MLKYFFLVYIITFSLVSCIETPNSFERIPPGIWRGEFRIQNQKQLINQEKKLITQEIQDVGRMDEIPEGIIPITFEVVYKENKKDFYINFINGTETIRVDNIKYGWDKRIARDTMRFDFPVYQSYLELAYENGVLEGNWHVKTRIKYQIPFRAVFGKKERFNNLKKKPISDISGTWATRFSPDSDDEFPAIGEFKQIGNHLTATFTTEAGDFRFLEGTIQDDKLYLSTFDGSHAFLFTGKIDKSNNIEGMFYSGIHYKTNWRAKRDPNFKLKPANEITFVTDPSLKISFQHPNEKGQIIDFNDPKYDGKVKLIKIMGTWCPNCIDETKFLVDYLNENPTDDLVIFALSYEKYKDITKINNLLSKYKEKYDVPYEVLYAGPVSKKETAKQFPMLNGISSYPTMIYIDKQNNIKKIYTGFYGPATSEYNNFTKEFKETIEELLKS